MKEENYTEAVVVVGKALKKCAALPARLKAKLFNLLGDCFRKLVRSEVEQNTQYKFHTVKPA